MTRKSYTKDFKKDAVKMLLKSRKSNKEVSDELGIPYGLLGRWKNEFDIENPENIDLKNVTDDRVKELEKEVAYLKQQRDILKKAMGIVLIP